MIHKTQAIINSLHANADPEYYTYRVEVAVRDPEQDQAALAALRELREAGLIDITGVRLVRLYVINGPFTHHLIDQAAAEFLTDPVVEMFAVNQSVTPGIDVTDQVIEIARLPGVMEPVESSALKGLGELGISANWVKTGRRYIISGVTDRRLLLATASRVLANPVIEQVSLNNPLDLDQEEYELKYHTRHEVPLAGLSDPELLELSKNGGLYFSLPELKVIQAFFIDLERAPTDVELETIAQTWSEHCSHKTMRGRVLYREEGRPDEEIDNLLKNTVARVTHELAKPWCWSVFEDNSGVIDFDGENGIAFKVETHNHPSAIEPYGGAGTGLGGVIRDPLGTGLGGKPILNTDVFCFGPPDLPPEQVPTGTLHPLRVFKGVTAGVRDYGNRMGIPTANGAILFDPRYTGNPLVFCGNLAIIPKTMAKRRYPNPGEIALVVGGRTGRDGIHGATFSSVELDENSETTSSGAVQIGNPIEEKKVADFLIQARDQGLYSCITDCGAGGLSSAIGEMGENCGVRVNLDKVPLKYEGLTYNEIWISEAQERMVIACHPDSLTALSELAKREGVEITPVAEFTDDQRLTLLWKGQEVGSLAMTFLHQGMPRPEREASWKNTNHPEPKAEDLQVADAPQALLDILAAWNVCSKEWVIRQYDHEVQGTSVLKPLVGVSADGPGDAVVITPLLGKTRAIAVANGINPRYSDIDPYWMAASAIDEALRNLVAVGASPSQIAILDNFCWGNCEKPECFGGLVRAAKACYDIALAYGVPFISGKDSLNNEFAVRGETLAIPGTLLISSLAILDDCRQTVSMDVKTADNLIYMAGYTRSELGASHYYSRLGFIGNAVPHVYPEEGLAVFQAVHQAIKLGLVRSAHDCSEGGLAVAAAEMAFAGHLGLDLDLKDLPVIGEVDPLARLFAESNSRLLLEIPPDRAEELEALFANQGASLGYLGVVTKTPRLLLSHAGESLVDLELTELRNAWKSGLGRFL
ncbi:MAG: phosphoribosylformylglycinamidine synthase subunit PurL [Planctomycetota bacterium]|jgi:phosphoribosylformylglycinamidine synthase|nr:phosphoribosylformylglycinamidine synthase subunit PurL [Planctomycetota bacterium]